jgi:hypothetical protein
MYFLALGELGPLGLLLLLALLWVMFRETQLARRRIDREDAAGNGESRKLMIALGGSIVGFAVSGAFLSVLYYPHLYVLAGLVVAAVGVLRTQSVTQENPVGAVAGRRVRGQRRRCRPQAKEG